MAALMRMVEEIEEPENRNRMSIVAPASNPAPFLLRLPAILFSPFNQPKYTVTCCPVFGE